MKAHVHRDKSPGKAAQYASKNHSASAKKRTYPLESEEQQTLFDWARWNENKYPDLARLVAIPNGGLRNMPEAVRFKKEGVRAGFPDMILPAPRRGYHSLAIELKRQKGAGGRASKEQRDWLEYLNAQGWRAVVCYGADEAIEVLEWYLGPEVIAMDKSQLDAIKARNCDVY